jgi:hypothetical protein
MNRCRKLALPSGCSFFAQALKRRLKTIGDSDYLFIEAGGFSTRNRPGWKVLL